MAKKPVSRQPTVSRQREYQLRKVAAGLCQICAKPRNLYKNECDECREKARELARKRKGFKPKREGFPGRNIRKSIDSSASALVT